MPQRKTAAERPPADCSRWFRLQPDCQKEQATRSQSAKALAVHKVDDFADADENEMCSWWFAAVAVIISCSSSNRGTMINNVIYAECHQTIGTGDLRIYAKIS